MRNIIISLILTISISFLSLNTLYSKSISGHVTEIGGGPLAAVKVYAQDASSIFTLTDSKGHYLIDVPDEVKFIVFSHTDFATKKMRIDDNSKINVVLIPKKYKKVRFGLGLTLGNSYVDIYNHEIISLPDTSVILDLKSYSISANLYYRINKNFDIQATLTEDLNLIQFTDSMGIEKTGNLNRFIVSVLFNYSVPVSKSGNYSIFGGMGPQFQKYGFLESSTVGLRFQLGMSFNNYGFNTKLFFAGDINSGTTHLNEIDGFKYSYGSSRVGIIFVF